MRTYTFAPVSEDNFRRRWKAQCIAHDAVAAEYDLWLIKNWRDMRGFLRSFDPGKGHASALVAHTSASLDALVRDIGGFSHTVHVLPESHYLQKVYRRHGYWQAIPGILCRDYG